MPTDAGHRELLSRRTLIQAGAAPALAAPLGIFSAKAFPIAPPQIDFESFAQDFDDGVLLSASESNIIKSTVTNNAVAAVIADQQSRADARRSA